MTPSVSTIESATVPETIDLIDRSISHAGNSLHNFGYSIVVALLKEARSQSEANANSPVNVKWASDLSVTSDQDGLGYIISVDTPSGRISYSAR